MVSEILRYRQKSVLLYIIGFPKISFDLDNNKNLIACGILTNILFRPDTYIGSVQPVTEPMWVFEDDSMVHRYFYLPYSAVVLYIFLCQSYSSTRNVCLLYKELGET